ncbi:MAG: hypothetical protein ACR2J3_12165 [Aridibacter sp.]
MQTTYEKALEIVSSLPPSDLQKLGQWIQTKQNRENNGDAKSEQVKEEIQKYKLAKKWIAEHKKEYLGQWVCLDGDDLISFGSDAIEVDKEARAKGIKAPFLERIIEEPKFYSDGWEMCR